MEDANTNKALEKKLYALERKNLRLKSDILFMERLFRLIGFPHGIESLKQSAEENLENSS